MRFALAASLALTTTAAFASADLPDGTYACVLDAAAFGAIKIDGDNYSTSKDSASFDEPAMFIVLDGKVQFLGDMTFLDVTGHRYDNAPVRPGPSGAAGFDLVVLTPDQSGFVTAACDIAL
jgi:hypothetical protein